MDPIQEFKITTKDGHHVEMDLRQTMPDRFECWFSDQEPELAKPDFVLIAKGGTALEAFSTAAAALRSRLHAGSRPDSITIVDNPCNAELLSVADQSGILGREVMLMLNGIAQS